MQRFFLLVVGLLLWQPVMAQDKPQPIFSIPHESSISGVRWHPNNHDFWTWNRNFFQTDDGNYDYQDHLQLWDGNTGKQEWQLNYHGDNVTMNLDWSAGEDRVLVYSGTSLEIWDALRGEKVWSYDNGTAHVSGARWDYNFRRILFWSYDDGVIHVWDTGINEATFHAETNMPSDLIDAKWSPDEKTIMGVLTQSPGRVQLWDFGSNQSKGWFEYPGMVYSADWSASDRLILINSDNYLQLVRVEKLTDESTQSVLLEKHDDPYLYRSIWSPNRQFVAVRVENDLRIEIWDFVYSKVISITQSGHVDNIISEVLWSKDNQRILTHSADGIDIWDITTGANLFRLPIEIRSYNMSWLSWSPDETKLVYMRSDSSLQIMTLTSHEAVELEMPSPITLSLPAPNFMWNKDGSQVMLSGVDAAARVWDTSSGKLLAMLEHPVHEGFQSQWVTDALWDPDEQSILTLGEPNYCVGVDTCPSEAMIWHAP